MNGTTHSPNHDLHRERQRLEALVPPTRRPRGWDLKQRLSSLGETTIRFLTMGNELQIWPRKRHGRSVWFAYDPVTNRTRSFYSEDEVHLWLDHRYYE